MTERIIGGAYQVMNTLGTGFLEKAYENAFAHELREEGLKVEQQKGIDAYYEGVVVGEFVADLLIEHLVLVELKVLEDFNEVHMAQCLNYLMATGLHVCLLISFGTARISVKRVVNDF